MGVSQTFPIYQRNWKRKRKRKRKSPPRAKSVLLFLFHALLSFFLFSFEKNTKKQ